MGLVMKHKIINGWTKAKMIEAVKTRNSGTQCYDFKTMNCMYEAPDGNHCAAGCFIPDGHEAMKSHKTIEVVSLKYSDLRLPLDHKGMEDMQFTHDSSSNHANMHDILIKFINEECEE